MQHTFNLVRISSFYHSALMVRTQRSTLLACIVHTAALNTDPNSCPPEVKPHTMKTFLMLMSSQTRPPHLVLGHQYSVIPWKLKLKSQDYLLYCCLRKNTLRNFLFHYIKWALLFLWVWFHFRWQELGQCSVQLCAKYRQGSATLSSCY